MRKVVCPTCKGCICPTCKGSGQVVQYDKRPWTMTELEAMRILKSQGVSDRIIGKRLGRTESAITSRLANLKRRGK